METMNKIEVKGRFIVAYSDEWKEKKVVGYLKKGMSLETWIQNKVQYDAKERERKRLIRQLIHFEKQATESVETLKDPSYFLNQCLSLERELDSLMTVK